MSLFARTFLHHIVWCSIAFKTNGSYFMTNDKDPLTFLLSFGAASTLVFSFTNDKSSLLTMTERLPARNENGGNLSDAREHLMNEVFITSNPSSP